MNKKVLIIEDNDDIRENVIEILELAGYTVASASNGKEGVEQAFKDVPDIILCDIMMPEWTAMACFICYPGGRKQLLYPLYF